MPFDDLRIKMGQANEALVDELETQAAGTVEAFDQIARVSNSLAAVRAALEGQLAELGSAFASRFDLVDGQLAALASRVKALEPVPARMLIGPVLYAFPGAKTDALIAKVPPAFLINPSTGAGSVSSSAYITCVAKAKAAGCKTYGYVHTEYGTRPIAEFLEEVGRMVSWYPVDGIFVDQTATSEAALPYYAELCAALRSRGLKVALNCGTRCAEGYALLADLIMVAETTPAKYRDRIANAWEAKPDLAAKTWHVVHTCPASDMPEMVRLAKQRRAGLFWCTDDVMANPYDVNPTYMDALVAAIAAA